MIWLTFIYILYRLYLVCIYKKHEKAISVSLLYRLCIFFTLFVCTKNIHIKFQVAFSWNFVQVLYSFVHFWYICRNLMFIAFTIIIIQNFDLYNFYIHKIYTNLVFCIILVYILDSFYSHFLVREANE